MIEKHGYKKQVILISLAVYFYLIIYFILPLLFIDYKFDLKQSTIRN